MVSGRGALAAIRCGARDAARAAARSPAAGGGAGRRAGAAFSPFDLSGVSLAFAPFAGSFEVGTCWAIAFRSSAAACRSSIAMSGSFIASRM
jgi:hypothetical protein